MHRTVGLLLAAGASSRFGAHKLLQALPDGTPVGLASAGVLQRALVEVVAVVQTGDDMLKEAFTGRGVNMIENAEAGTGMASSIRAGIMATADADAWLIALADMPWIHPATVKTLAAYLQQGASVVAPAYNGRRGHPVGFSAEWKDDLLCLGGDSGARQLLEGHQDKLTIVATDDAGVIRDVDYPQDLMRWPGK